MSLFEFIAYTSYALLFGAPYVTVKSANRPFLKWWALTILAGYGFVIGVPIAFDDQMQCSQPSACMGVGLAWIGATGVGIVVNLIALVYAATRPVRY